jgi:RHS repeat-associated protein
MAGISSKALSFGGPENKKKYQQYEFNSDFDLNLYESFYRTHDPQIGRFLQIDPKVDSFYAWSPYVAMLNNPIKFVDILGNAADTTKPDGNYFPAPKTLPGFPDASKRQYNPESGRQRWKLPDGSILEWDKQHGEVEKYDKNGKKHQGSYDPETGEQIKDPVPGRTTPKFNPLPDNSNPFSLDKLLYPQNNMPLSPSPPQAPGSSNNGETAVKAGVIVVTVYVIWKLIGVAATIGTGGAAAPVLAL